MRVNAPSSTLLAHSMVRFTHPTTLRFRERLLLRRQQKGLAAKVEIVTKGSADLADIVDPPGDNLPAELRGKIDDQRFEFQHAEVVGEKERHERMHGAARLDLRHSHDVAPKVDSVRITIIVAERAEILHANAIAIAERMIRVPRY